MPTTVQGQPEESGSEPSWWSRHEQWVLTIGSGLALAVGMAFSWLGPAVGLSEPTANRLAVAGYALAVVIGGVGLFPRAARNLRRLHLDIDVLMGLAILGAMALGQWDEAATVAFLYGLSEALEGLSLDRARRSIRALLDLAPPTAERIGPDGTVQVVPASQVRAGDRLLVRAGDTIPVDGEVVSGRSSVDQKTITGESVPVVREPGRPGLRRDGQRRGDAGGPGVGTGGGRVDLAGRRPGPGQPGGPGADRAADLPVRRGLHADRRGPVAAGHAAGPAGAVR